MTAVTGPTGVTGAGVPADPFVPAPWRVVARREEAVDVVTLWIDRPSSWTFRSGQFNMLTVFGVGEVAISISAAPHEEGPIRHTIRDVGAVSHALCESGPGALVGVRGPFGSDWGADAVGPDEDVVVVAGGIGLAPLRGAIAQLASRRREGQGRLFVAVGARLPDQVIFADELDAWRATGAAVGVTVDPAPAGFSGRVGLVTTLLPEMGFDPTRTRALVCGPEVMMRFAGRELAGRGVDPRRIAVSLERNMQCGVGLCGHCQLGPVLLCRDGPVLPYAQATALLREHER